MTSLISPPPLPGDIVASYTLIETLGVGGNATVYRAESNSGLDVALKILHPGKTTEEDVRRFRREFLSLQSLEHPNIVQVYEAGFHGDYPWISMEYVDGMDLNALIKKWKSDPTDDRNSQIEYILKGLCAALDYVHRKGMIHRDLKPSNVLISKTGLPKLTDFGVVKAPTAFKSELTTLGRLVGTVAFMAPEHIMGEALDSRADLYSLGALLYMCLTFKKPFEASSIAGYLSMHLTQDPPRPQEKNPDTPDHLDQICTKLLQKEPNKRYSSAAEILQVIETKKPFPKLFGREREIQIFHEALSLFLSGNPMILNFFGAPKSGKTTLLQRMLIEVEIQNITCHDLHQKKLQDIQKIGDSAVFIDDLHSMDTQDISMLESQLLECEQHGESFLLITSSQQSPSILPSLQLTQQIQHELLPLQPEEIERLLREENLTGVTAIILSRRLSEHIHGNIGLILETLQLLKDKNWLLQTKNQKYKSSIPIEQLRERPLPVPKSLKKEIQQKISMLSSEARHLLECLVVLNIKTTLHHLSAFTAKDVMLLEAAIEELKQNDWIHRNNEKNIDIININSPLMSKLYLLLPKDRKIAWHQRIASVLCKRGKRRVNEIAEQVAHHFLQSKQEAIAFPFLITAAQRKYRNQQFSEAKKILKLAEGILPKIKGETSQHQNTKAKKILFELLGKMHKKNGESKQAQNYFEQALLVATEVGEQKWIAQLGSLLCLCQNHQQLQAKQLESYLENLDEGDPIWGKGYQALAIHFFDNGLILEAEAVWKKLSKSQHMQNRAAGESGIGLLDTLAGTITHGIMKLDNYHASLEDRWILWLIELSLLGGWWKKALNRAADIAERARTYANPSIGSYAIALQARAAFYLGSIEHCRLLIQEANAILPQKMNIISTKAFIHLSRLTLDLGEPLPEKSPTIKVETIDALQTQWKYIQARVHLQTLETPDISTPWAQAFAVLDYLKILQKNNSNAWEKELDILWDRLSTTGKEGILIPIAQMGMQSTDSLHWKTRLKKSLDSCIDKQPEHFMLQERWLNPTPFV